MKEKRSSTVCKSTAGPVQGDDRVGLQYVFLIRALRLPWEPAPSEEEKGQVDHSGIYCQLALSHYLLVYNYVYRSAAIGLASVLARGISPVGGAAEVAADIVATRIEAPFVQIWRAQTILDDPPTRIDTWLGIGPVRLPFIRTRAEQAGRLSYKHDDKREKHDT